MMAVALTGILVGSLVGVRSAVAALIPLIVAALLGAVLHAVTGHLGEAAIGFAVFSVSLQGAYVVVATIRTAIARGPRPIRRLVEENDEGLVSLHPSPR
jgi:hypothetical protein